MMHEGHHLHFDLPRPDYDMLLDYGRSVSAGIVACGVSAPWIAGSLPCSKSFPWCSTNGSKNLRSSDLSHTFEPREGAPSSGGLRREHRGRKSIGTRTNGVISVGVILETTAAADVRTPSSATPKSFASKHQAPRLPRRMRRGLSARPNLPNRRRDRRRLRTSAPRGSAEVCTARSSLWSWPAAGEAGSRRYDRQLRRPCPSAAGERRGVAQARESEAREVTAATQRVIAWAPKRDHRKRWSAARSRKCVTVERAGRQDLRALRRLLHPR